MTLTPIIFSYLFVVNKQGLPVKLGIGQKPEEEKNRTGKAGGSGGSSKQLAKFLKMSKQDDLNPAALYLQQKVRYCFAIIYYIKHATTTNLIKHANI